MTGALEYRYRQATRSVWVFTLNVEHASIDDWQKPRLGSDKSVEPIWPLRHALGLEFLDPDRVEVFLASEIAEYGLAKYLVDANGFEEDDIQKDVDLLAGLQGVVALVFSEALGQRDAKIRPMSLVSFVARYDVGPDLRVAAPIVTESAQGGLTPKPVSPQPSKMPLWPFVLFLILVGGLFAVLAVPKL